MALLEINNLKTHFFTPSGIVKAVNGISYTVEAGEVVAIVGESGCGKSVGAMSVMKLIPNPPGRIVDGEIIFDGQDLVHVNDATMREIRGNQIAMVFQEPMTSLNPVLTIGRQLTETLELHERMNSNQANQKAVELLNLVGIPDAEGRLKDYPHQFSGGMRQRVMIAMALSCNPKLIIADEPTTALDVTIQAQILELMQKLSTETGTALIIITHNLGVVARYAHRVIVMYAGRIVEMASAVELYTNPQHPYTKGLLNAVPRLDEKVSSKLEAVEGMPPDLREPTICQNCGSEEIVLKEIGNAHFVAKCLGDDNCDGWFPRDLD